MAGAVSTGRKNTRQDFGKAGLPMTNVCGETNITEMLGQKYRRM